MSVIINGVSCEEIVKGYSESLDTKATSTKSYLCSWDQRYRVITGLVGFASAVSRNGSVSFTAPFRHPETNLYPTSIAVRGVGRPSQGVFQLAFQAAIVDVTFGVLSWSALPEQDPSGDQTVSPDGDAKFLYCSQRITYGAEYHTVPGSKLQVLHPIPGGSQTKPFNKDMTVRVAHAEMSLTFHKLPYMPVNFLPLIDHVNTAKFLGCARGTVRFNGGETRREQQSDGSITQAVDFSFSYRPRYEWNMSPDPYFEAGGVGTDWAIVQYKSGNAIFPYDDLSVVFPPGYLYS